MEPPLRDTREEALDLLIDQYQRLFAIYDTRRGNAETKAAGILTATVAIAALTATAASLVKHVNLALVVLAVVLVVLLALSVIAAIYASSAAGLYGRRARKEWTVDKPPLLSTESPQYRRAAHTLKVQAAALLASCQNHTSEAITVRVEALELWQERQLDAHHLAQKKDQGTAVAGIMLGFALACGAAIVALIVIHSR